jgi:hypothetical protein
MGKNKIVKSVSFNVLNERDQVYLDKIKEINFSGYVKWLIEKDIRQRKVIKLENREVQHVIKDGPVIIRGSGLSLKTV